ncbi:hypothetical protein [Nonomuraea sp. NPDC005650]|uniref:hypothetical protein n=1 Tax=Nonomuraea sp. NPDC005650 TaxID=3157045 RepID=UPI00339DBB47
MITTTPPAAGIGTATVDLKTLTVNGRRMTLTVFRQIREERLIAHDGTLNGQPWGAVNYHPDRCGDRLPHWHIVWQRGAELLRSYVYEKPSFDWPTDFYVADRVFQAPQIDRYLTLAVHEWVTGHTETLILTKEPTSRGYDPKRTFVQDGLRVSGTVSDVAIAAVKTKHAVDNLSPIADDTDSFFGKMQRADRQKTITEAEQAQGALFEEVNDWDLTPAEIDHEFHAAISTELERRQRHRDVRAQLAELPQLFIAL